MITSRQNPLVKQFRKLHRSKERHRQGLILLEGTNLMTAIADHDYPLEVLCYTEQWEENHGDLLAHLLTLSQRHEIISPDLISIISTTVNADGVAAIAQPRSANLITNPDIAPAINLGLVLETIQDPGNVGTIFRTAAAVGVDHIWLSADCANPESPKVLRASAGAWLQLPWAMVDDLPSLIRHHQSQGTQIIGTSSHSNQSYWALNFNSPTLMVIGNEGAGLSPEVLSLCDHQAMIPVAPGVESLNAAIATALMLYEAKRQIMQ